MRSRWRPMRSSSPDESCRSLSQRKTPLALPESCTTSCGPSNLKTAGTGAMNGSLSSLTSPSPTWRPTLVSSLIRTKSAEVLPSRAIADSRALGFAGAAGLGGAGGGARMPVTGFGGGGGAGRAPAVGGLVAVGAAALVAAGAGLAAAAAGGAGFRAAAGGAGRAAGAVAFAAGFAGAGVAVCCGAPVAPSGVPHRAQNLNVAAFSVMQFGHCLGGAPAASRGPVLPDAAGGVAGFCIIVGKPSSIGAPHERQEPTSVSLFAPQRGHSMGVLVFRAPREGQGYGKGGDVVVIVDGDGDVNVAVGDRRAASTATSPSPSTSTLTSTSTLVLPPLVCQAFAAPGGTWPPGRK